MLLLHPLIAQLALFLSTQAQAHSQPQPTIHLLKATGTACPPPTLTTTLDQNTTRLAHTITSLRSNIGPGHPFGDTNEFISHRENCTTYHSIALSSPTSRLVANAHGIDASGYMEVGSQGTMRIYSTYEWVGAGQEVKIASSTFKGPYEGRFERWNVSGRAGGGLASMCGGGVLKVVYEVRAVADPGARAPVRGDAKEGWEFGMDVAVEECGV